MNSGKIPNHENFETDIVVIGGGGTGLSAAIAATESKARVIVLEERKTAGGNSVFPEALFAVESPVQKRLMVDAPRDDFFRKDLNYSHYKINPRIIRALINKSGDTVRWLEEMGVKFDLYPHSNYVVSPQVCHYPKGCGVALVKALVKRCEDLGVTILYQTEGKKILTGQKGQLTGVLAVIEDTEIKIAAKCVIIATGGYAGNRELMNKYCPSYVNTAHLHGLPHKGTGLLMTTEIGAATEGLGILHLSAPYFPWRREIWSVAKEPNMLWVNKKGERFIDETVGDNHFETANPLSRQPGKCAFSLFDRKIKERYIDGEGFISRGGYDFRPGSVLPDLDSMLQEEAVKGRIKISDSWEDIAEWIGVAPNVLKATIDEYNSCCDRGKDEVFGKEQRCLTALRFPPYYAIKTYLRITTTIGGIKINHNMEVLDQQESAIPGLYAGGADAGGWETDTYNLTLPGKAYAFACNSGRIAGEEAAKYVSGR